MIVHTNLVCMRCWYTQPVQRDQLPSRCEYCRESFTAHGYFLHDDSPDAKELSQDVLGGRASLRLAGVGQ